MYRTRFDIYLARDGRAVLLGDPAAMALLVPANTLIRQRTAEQYGLAALEGAHGDADVPFSDEQEEKAHAGPPATKARSGPQRTKAKGYVSANAQPEDGGLSAQRENSA